MRFRDLFILIFVILIVAMLIIPLPSPMIDVLIIVNISLSLMIILVAMNMKEPLDFSIFPTVLLLATLFRVGISVSTTRAILGRAEAGEVIDTFGNFVVGSNPLVGFVVFLILVVIQFIVIVKGAERVSEVGARFTLDAMPGKQMSIDADLNAGMITDQEAKKRREKIEKEADFYGSMDGASKFVKGDAIVGIVIVLINIIFGFIIGMAQMGMSFQEAASTYTLLTVGDGLVTQIPALLIATATGIVVTRAASDGTLGADISKQMLAYPKLLYIAAAAIFLLGIFTPIPILLTMPIALFLGIGGYVLDRKAPEVEEEKPIEEPEEEPTTPNNVTDLLTIDPVEFEFGYGLIPLADSNQGGDLLDRVVMIRRQLALELGMIVPVIRIRDNIQLKPNEYVIKIRGNEVSRSELLLDHYMAMSPGVDDESITGIETVEPAFGLKALWVDDLMKDEAELSGYTVVDPPSVVSTHLTEVLKNYAHELLTREETKQLVEHIKETHPTLVEEVTPNPLSLGDVQKVLKHLLKEKVSIRNLPVIFETLADYGSMFKDPQVMAEYARQSLSRQITKAVKPVQGGPLYVVTLSGSTEKAIADALQQTEHGSYLSLTPDQSQKMLRSIQEEVVKLTQMGQSPVVLCSPAVRMHVKQLIERIMPHVPVLSYNELEPDLEIQSVGVVNVA
ncbi:flagellar biosynthesis protein FlhA [Geomicrobium sediminis]|uniref:Flagellar biosynthesis protein FlhA n=1 Tax=Geomicrobium sediminis TaxID=1347788 RepID=A0ABS2PBC6_9BACL|nr:flagellar biosynthesis protein FlhA [Geomicrobium sediminis]MBM7632609.1 flagellar biosynthesis protein FlhA [Geomicrobium sediminis]